MKTWILSEVGELLCQAVTRRMESYIQMCCASKTASSFFQFFCVQTKPLPFFPRIIFRSHPFLNKNIMFFRFVLNYYVTIFCAKFLILFSDNDPQQIFIHDNSFKNLFKSDAICRPVSCPNWNSDAQLNLMQCMQKRTIYVQPKSQVKLLSFVGPFRIQIDIINIKETIADICGQPTTRYVVKITQL